MNNTQEYHPVSASHIPPPNNTHQHTRNRSMDMETSKPPTQLRFVELDSVRALAALWVFAYHVWQFGGNPTWPVSLAGFSFDLFAPIQHGPAGVDVFMVLSGFCLFWPLTKKPASFQWKDYAIKRARRILPAYYGAMAYAILAPILLVFAVRMAGWEANMQPIPSLRQILTHLFFIHTLFPDTWNGITGAFWSMGLEAQFYIVFPFLVWAWKRIGIRSIAYAALASLVFRMVVDLLLGDADPATLFLLSITFLGRWMQFAAGMAAALWVRHTLEASSGPSPAKWTGIAVASALLELTGLIAPAISQGPVPLRDILLAAGSAGLLASICTAPNWIKSPLVSGPLPFLGRISYSFFLIHQPTSWYAMEFFRKKMAFTGVPLTLLGYSVGLLVTVLCSAAFFLVFEKPFLAPTKAPSSPVPVPRQQAESVA
jgi:peptidoglycan/LPS O-acetylase OafA/YrhL